MEKRLCLRVPKDGGGSDFYTVDVNKGTFSPILEGLEKDVPLRFSVLVTLGSVVCNVGFFPTNVYHGRFSPTYPQYAEALCFDLRSPGWREFSNINFSYPITHPVICKNKIYSLGKGKLVTYDPNSNPPSFQSSRITFDLPSYPLISDPCSDRILMQFRDSGLYAFDPENAAKPFVCIDPDLSLWSERTVLADGVLYFYHGRSTPIRAYDLCERKSVQVKWTSSGYGGAEIDDQWSCWAHFFHLGNGNLCLVRYNYCTRILYTFPFKVEKDPTGESIVATPGIMKEYKLKAASGIVNFFTI